MDPVTWLSTGGPLGLLAGCLVTVYLLIARGRLVPKPQVDSLLALKQQLIDYQAATNERAAAALDAREERVEALITELSALAREMRTRT